MEAVAETPQIETPESPTQGDQIVALLERMSARIEEVAAEVESVKQAGPRFVPASVETYGAANERHDLASKAPADGVPRSQTVPVFTNGEKVPDLMMRQYPARFGPGTRVQLNPDAVPHGRTDGKTRAELKDADGTPWGVAEVIDRKFLTNEGTWKYKVRFANPRVVTGAHGGITMFHEPELIPA